MARGEETLQRRLKSLEPKWPCAFALRPGLRGPVLLDVRGRRAPAPSAPRRCCCVGGAGGPGARGLGDSLGIRHFIRTWVVSVSTSLQKRRAFQSVTCEHRCWGRGGPWTARDFSPTAGVSLPLELWAVVLHWPELAIYF